MLFVAALNASAGDVAHVLSLQTHPILGDKQANLAKIDSMLEPYRGTQLDLVLLPEFFSTGIHHPTMVGQPEDGRGGDVIAHICQLAKEFRTNIVAGSVIELDGDKRYNTTFAINRDGEIVGKYRKIHLYSYLGGTEHQRITPGNSTEVVDFDFARVGLCICFDSRYPQHFRELVGKVAEIIACPTALCALHAEKERQIGVWRAFNLARASENLVYFVSCNGADGINEKLTNTGHSMVVSPLADVVAELGETEGAMKAEIDLDLVREMAELRKNVVLGQ